MTPVEQARASIEQMLALSQSDRMEPRPWDENDADSAEARSARSYNHALSFVGPDRLARICTEALGVLDRHTKRYYDYASCTGCNRAYPCPEVVGILKAWSS